MHRSTLLGRNMHMQEDEEITLVTRKHWFILLVDILSIAVVSIVPFIFAAIIAPFVSIHPALPSFFISIWLLVIWMMIFTVWTNYYLDIWIVTNKRIINIDQIHLFKRDVSTLRMERVQDVKVETHGFFATMFKFGNLQVQTAGPESSFYLIKGIPNPAEVRNTILERVDMTTEHKTSFVYNRDQRPPDSV